MVIGIADAAVSLSYQQRAESFILVEALVLSTM